MHLAVCMMLVPRTKLSYFILKYLLPLYLRRKVFSATAGVPTNSHDYNITTPTFYHQLREAG